MTHRNLGLYHITFERAADVLARAKKKKCWIQNNTMLYEHPSDRNTYGVCYSIQLHDTPILTFYKDGAIRIRTDDWADAPTTKNRLRSYLPGNLSISWGRLRPIRRPHIVIVKSDNGHTSKPLGTNRVFLPDGMVDGLHLMNQLDAIDVWKEVEQFAKKFTQAFLLGKLEGMERNITRKDDKTEMEYALRLLKGEEPMNTRPLNVSFVNWLPDRQIFYKENYAYSSPTAPKKKGVNLADWMERRILWDDSRFRPEPGSYRHQKIRKDVKNCVCSYFENALMYID
jgi:hypothetical protein